MATKKGAENWKAKQWFDVHTPEVLGDEVIGSIPAASESAVIGRVLKVSLSWVTHNPAHSFLSVSLLITKAQNNVANSEIKMLENQFSHIHSLVRRHADAIYTYDKIALKDNKTAVVKLFISTRSKVPYSKQHALRKEVSAMLNEYAQTHSRDELIKSVLSNELQSQGLERLHKVAPVAKLEIRKLEF